MKELTPNTFKHFASQRLFIYLRMGQVDTYTFSAYIRCVCVVNVRDGSVMIDDIWYSASPQGKRLTCSHRFFFCASIKKWSFCEELLFDLFVEFILCDPKWYVIFVKICQENCVNVYFCFVYCYELIRNNEFKFKENSKQLSVFRFVCFTKIQLSYNCLKILSKFSLFCYGKWNNYVHENSMIEPIFHSTVIRARERKIHEMKSFPPNRLRSNISNKIFAP